SCDLIQKGDRPPPYASRFFCACHDFFDFLNGGQDGAEGNECRLGHACDDLCERRFADAGRSPQNHRRNLIPFDRRPQRLTGAQEMVLTEHFIERLRPHALREWCVCRGTVDGLVFVFEKRSAHVNASVSRLHIRSPRWQSPSSTTRRPDYAEYGARYHKMTAPRP